MGRPEGPKRVYRGLRRKVAFEGKGPQTQPQRRLGRRLEEVAEVVGGGYCRLQMPLRLALGVRGTVAGHRLGALEGARASLLRRLAAAGRRLGQA